MSLLSNLERMVLKQYARKGWETLELFPGSHLTPKGKPNKMQSSAEYLHSITQAPVVTIGDKDFVAQGSIHMRTHVPPYPAFDHRFDLMLLCEPFWMFYAEGKGSLGHREHTKDGGAPESYPRIPQGMRFLQGHLKDRGYLALTHLYIGELAAVRRDLPQGFDLHPIIHTPTQVFAYESLQGMTRQMLSDLENAMAEAGGPEFVAMLRRR